MDQKVQTARSQIEQFVQDDYLISPNSGECQLPEGTKARLRNSLQILSEQLYSKDIHFIFELFQNAEDNHYSTGVTPTLSFELLETDPTNTPGCKGCLVVRNNEVGFTIDNIKAICSIGESTKANQKDQGYIGEKGIGFKSVFVVSPSPHIISNGFQVKLPKEDDKTGLGYIVPYWLNHDICRYTGETGTTLLLPLQDRLGSQVSMFEKVQEELSKLYAELILFLSKLRKVTVKTPQYYAHYELRKDGDYAELSVESSSGNSCSKYLLKSKAVSVPESAKNSLRKNVTRRDVSLAFPVGFELEESPLFCYLPTESDTGLPFLVNADFILSASRESIRKDLDWNGWMRDEVANFSASILAEILSSEGDCSRWRWVPVWSRNRVLYWDKVIEKVKVALSTTKCIPSLTGSYQLPSNSLLLSPTFNFLKSWPLSILQRLSKHITFDEDGLISQISKSIGLKEFDKEYFVELLQCLNTDDFIEDEDLVSAFVEITSLSHVRVRGQSQYKYRDQLSLLRDCNLFKCSNGLQSVKYKNLYLPSDDSHEVPILENNKGESTKPNYIDVSFYRLLPETVKTGIRLLFDIQEVHVVSYLEKSVYTFLKENRSECLPKSLKATRVC